MNRPVHPRRVATFVLALLAASSLAAPLAAASPFQAADDGGANLVGTFLVTATFTDPPDLPPTQVLITFMPGRSASEGTLVDTNQFQLTPNPVCSPDQGVWKKKGNGYIATHYNFCFDATAGYAPAGPTKVRDRLFLGNGGETFTGTQFIEGFDNDGNVVFTGKVTVVGQRLHAEAPPAD